MIKPLCKVCGERHWVHEGHGGGNVADKAVRAKPKRAKAAQGPVVRSSDPPNEPHVAAPDQGTGEGAAGEGEVHAGSREQGLGPGFLDEDAAKDAVVAPSKRWSKVGSKNIVVLRDRAKYNAYMRVYMRAWRKRKREVEGGEAGDGQIDHGKAG